MENKGLLAQAGHLSSTMAANGLLKRDPMGVSIEFPRRQLFVPPGVALPPSRSVEVDGAMSNIGERIDGEMLTGERGSPERLVEVLSGLNAADVIQTASKILMRMESLPTKGIREAQGDFVELFPAEEQGRIRGLMASTFDGKGILFYPQQLVALQRLATAFGRPGNPMSWGDENLEQFLKACAWTGDVATSMTEFDGTKDVDNETIAIWAIRTGEVNRLTFYRATAGRSFQMWFNSGAAWPDHLTSLDDYCDEHYGLTYREFVALAIAPALPRVGTDLSLAVIDPAQFLRDSRFDPSQIDRVFSDLIFESVATDPGSPESYWDFTQFAHQPYVRAPGRNLVAVSARFAFERATTGTFWMLHQAHAGSVGDFTKHFGAVFQDYCLRLGLLHDLVTGWVRPPDGRRV